MKSITIYKPFTPSSIVKCETFNATEISIACGGGMGGSFWEEYTRNLVDLNKQFINIDTNLSRDENINTNYIVKTKPVKIAKLVVINEGNKNIPEGENIYYYEIPIDAGVELKHCYGSNPEKIICHWDF